MKTYEAQFLRNSFCRNCGKRGYYERRAAKQAMKRMNESGLSVYWCRHGGDVWHIGHLWPEVRAGEMDRSDIRAHKPRPVR